MIAPLATTAAPGLFTAFTHADVRDLIAAYPLAWLVSGRDGGEASLLPLLGEYGADGALTNHPSAASPSSRRPMLPASRME